MSPTIPATPDALLLSLPVAEPVTAGVWYLAFSRPRLEPVARDQLLRQGYEAYLPLYKRIKKTADATQIVFEPMFARYLFVRPGRDGQSIAPIRSTTGVSHLVKFGITPGTLSPTLVDAVRVLEQQRNAADMEALSALRPGQQVRLLAPAFSKLQGLVQSVSSKRVTVLLELLGSPQRVELQHHQLAAV